MSYFADFDNELCSYMCYCGDLMASFAHHLSYFSNLIASFAYNLLPYYMSYFADFDD